MRPWFSLPLPQTWNSITGKGCCYLDTEGQEEGVMKCHHYRLNLPAPTQVWIEVGVASPGIPATDILLFVFHTDDDEKPTQLITCTQHKIEQVIVAIVYVCLMRVHNCVCLKPFVLLSNRPTSSCMPTFTFM